MSGPVFGDRSSVGWRKYGTLHEWSHNLGLDSHLEGGYDCNGAVPTVTDGDVMFGGPLCPQSPGPQDMGSVLCNVYGCRPNGALVQTPNGGVYVIQNNQKRWITSPLVLNTWSDFSDVIPISDDEGKAYVDGPQVGFRSGKLIAYGGAVYFITNDGGDWYRGYKRWVTSPTVLTQCFPNLPITAVDGALANLHTTAQSITGCVPTHPNGLPVVVPGDAVYLLHANQRRWVISQAVQNSWFFGPDLIEITMTERNNYTQGSNVGFRPGRLIRKSSTGAIYFVTNEGEFGLATKRHVTNPTTLGCIFPGKPWIESTDFEVDNHPTGSAIQIPAC